MKKSLFAGCARGRTQAAPAPGGSLSPHPAPVPGGHSLMERLWPQPDPWEQPGAAMAHITPPLPRWEHGKTQGSEAGERRMPREKGWRCPAHSMGRMTTIVRLLNGSFGIIPSAAFQSNTHFWVSNRKRRQNHEAGGRKHRNNSTSSKEH